MWSEKPKLYEKKLEDAMFPGTTLGWKYPGMRSSTEEDGVLEKAEAVVTRARALRLRPAWVG